MEFETSSSRVCWENEYTPQAIRNELTDLRQNFLEEFIDSNVSDDGLSLAASFAINEQISKETSTANTSASASDNGLSIAASIAFNEEISEETDTTDNNDSDDGLSLATSACSSY